jgi:stress response protein SCP2/uncharacterized protein involved in tellurium resistance
MSVTLPKGGNLRLAAAAPGIEQVRVELGWCERPAGPAALEVEVDGVIVVDQAGPAAGSPEVLLAHQPGDVEAETVVVTLAAIPPEIPRLRFGAAIFDATGRRQTFRQVGAPYIRVLNQADGVEIARYDVTPETGQETALVFGELYRHAGSWKFRAVGQGYTNGLLGLAESGREVALARPTDVAAFLTRSSPTRSRRKVADHLHPPLPAAKQAPGPSRPSTQRPAAPSRPGGPVFSRPPVTPRSPAAPPRPAPPAPPRPEPPAPSRPEAPAPPRPATWSPLDLDDASPPAPSSPPGASPSPAPGGRSALDLAGGSHASPPPAGPSGRGRSPLDLDGDGAAPSAAGRAGPAGGGSSGGGSALDLGGGPYGAPPRAGQGAGHAALDLGGQPAVPGGATASAGDRPGAVVFGERSSRYRQRVEHVTALDDGHPVTAWTAEKRGSGSLTVTLRWTSLTTRTGLPRPSDLQLGCLWQSLDGASGVLQTLGGATSAPGAGATGRQVLALTPRDEHEGQKMFVDLRALTTFKRFFVFAYGLHGAPEWDLLRPVLTVTARTGENLEIRLGEAPAGARTCVVASFHVAQDDLVIRRENDFLPGPQADAAQRYGWTLDWNPDGLSLRER